MATAIPIPLNHADSRSASATPRPGRQPGTSHEGTGCGRRLYVINLALNQAATDLDHRLPGELPPEGSPFNAVPQR